MSPKIAEHLSAMQSAGTDTEAFLAALRRIRGDLRLQDAEREQLHHAIATECYFWFLEAVSGAPVDRAAYAKAVAEQSAAAT